jgi:hypothetical protein
MEIREIPPRAGGYPQGIIMNRKKHSTRSDLPHDTDLSEERCRQRLQETFGVNRAGVDMILRLRRQVLALQNHVRDLEVQLTSLEDCYRNSLLTRYRETFVETSWRDLRREERE